MWKFTSRKLAIWLFRRSFLFLVFARPRPVAEKHKCASMLSLLCLLQLHCDTKQVFGEVPSLKCTEQCQVQTCLIYLYKSHSACLLLGTFQVAQNIEVPWPRVWQEFWSYLCIYASGIADLTSQTQFNQITSKSLLMGLFC